MIFIRFLGLILLGCWGYSTFVEKSSPLDSLRHLLHASWCKDLLPPLYICTFLLSSRSWTKRCFISRRLKAIYNIFIQCNMKDSPWPQGTFLSTSIVSLHPAVPSFSFATDPSPSTTLFRPPCTHLSSFHICSLLVYLLPFESRTVLFNFHIIQTLTYVGNRRYTSLFTSSLVDMSFSRPNTGMNILL